MTTLRIPLTQPIETRDGSLSQDSRTTNAVFERRDDKRELVKRPGWTTDFYTTGSSGAVNSQGLFAVGPWLCAVANDTMYVCYPPNPGVSHGSVFSTGSAFTSGGRVYGTTDSSTSYFVYHDTGTTLRAMNSSGVNAPISSPTTYNFVPGSAYLDGYIFVGDVNNHIWNSNINDPFTWNALGFVTFSTSSDPLVAITKHLNYVMALGKSSIAFYYDAAVAAPASPLALAPSYTLETGCANGDSVVSSSNTVFWISTSRAFGKQVCLLDGLSPVVISTPAIDRILEADTLATVWAYCYRFKGHTCYVLSLGNTGVTLVYDLEMKQWYQWTSYNGTSEGMFDPGFYTQINRVPVFLSSSTSGISYPLQTVYQDDSNPIYCRSITDLSDNGTTKAKFYGRLEIIGDKQTGSTMQVSHTGNDYQSYSTARTIDLSAPRSQIYQCGRDRRRAWQFLHTSNTPLRLDSAEIDFRLGEMDQEQNIGGGRYRT